jgi:DNA-directed RNA polymerase specialized sigma24 family protein
MDANAGFPDFVSARWPRLYRLAYLLTADEGRARTLLGAAMEDAGARWANLADVDAADAHVRSVMVGALVAPRRTSRLLARLDLPPAVPPPPSQRGDEVDHRLLWALACALPDRQRAVLVLLYFEQLDPREVAGLLGSSPGVVRSQVADGVAALGRGLAVVRADDVSREEPVGETLVLGAADPRPAEDRPTSQPPISGQDLRTALVAAAENHHTPAPDPEGLVARGGARRRRRRRGRLAVAIGVVCLAATAWAGQVVTLGSSDDAGGQGSPRDAGAHVYRPLPGGAVVTRIPWCVPDSGAVGAEELVVGEGRPVRAWCRWHGLNHLAGRVHLWHHAGSTLLVGSDGARVVVGGGLRALQSADVMGPVAFSHDGRLVAMITRAPMTCQGHLYVYDMAREGELAWTPVPREGCGAAQGIDDLGRVYVTVDEDQSGLVVLVYDVWTRKWTEVSGVPSGTSVYPDAFGITYVTREGFAVQTAEHAISMGDGFDALALSSQEGTVEAHGRFVPGRPTPVGNGLWSPNRSLVVDQRPEGVVVHRAGDLTHRRVLDLPTARFRARPDRLPHTNLQWLSDTALLVSSTDPGLQPVYRCHARSGHCTRVRRVGEPALGNSAFPLG